MRRKSLSRKAPQAKAAHTDADAVNARDRAFFLWLLASLVTGTVISGGIAMWAAVMTLPPLG